jgi:hypothetical protein
MVVDDSGKEVVERRLRGPRLLAARTPVPGSAMAGAGSWRPDAVLTLDAAEDKPRSPKTPAARTARLARIRRFPVFR